MAPFLAACLVLALALLLAVYAWFHHRCDYWRRRGVLQMAASFPFGSACRAILRLTRFEFLMQEAYNRFKGEKCVGLYAFTFPMLVLIDPDLIRLVLVKNFDSFADRGVPYNKQEPLFHNLFFMNGPKWKRLRSKLTPVFTSGKLKTMYQTLVDCAGKLVLAVEASVPTDIPDLCARYSTDVIASVAFGVECDSLRNPDAEFRQWGRKVFDPTLKFSIVHLLQIFAPSLAKVFRCSAGTEEMSEYFRNMVRQTVEHREALGVTRPDLMQLLIQLKNRGVVDGGDAGSSTDNWNLSMNEVAAQAFVFFAAGFESVATTMSFALYELALSRTIQGKLQHEVDAAIREYGGQLTYEALCSMAYLDKVVSETLRKYPPGACLARQCTRRFKIPGSGSEIEEGTHVFVPVYALHHDPQHFPDPSKFDPERFSDEAKAARHPYAYLPFGEGLRNCIGARLGLLEAKVGLSYLMANYNVRLCVNTKETLNFSASSYVLTPSTGIQLMFNERVDRDAHL